MTEYTAEERDLHQKMFTAFVKLAGEFQAANKIDLTMLAKSQIWALKETARRGGGIEIGSEDDVKLTNFFIEHVSAFMQYISNGNIPCLH